MSASLGTLENRLGHRFSDIKLLERALTHRSWAYENLAGIDEGEMRLNENESLEFLGDSVLGLLIAEQLFLKHPTLGEGGLTQMKHLLVSSATLANIAERLELGEYLKFGRGEEKTGGRRKQALLANTFEAILGAIYLDGGYAAARVFVKNVFRDEIAAATPEASIDHKTTLQEMLQAGKRKAPRYQMVRTEGPPHDRIFYVEAEWEGGTAAGEGSSIKSAEMDAAHKAIEILKTERERTDAFSAK